MASILPLKPLELSLVCIIPHLVNILEKIKPAQNYHNSPCSVYLCTSWLTVCMEPQTNWNGKKRKKQNICVLECFRVCKEIIYTSGFFFRGGTGGFPPSGKNFVNPPPSNTCPRFWTMACPPPAEVRPQKFEKFKYIFVSNLTTFKLKSTLKAVFHA